MKISHLQEGSVASMPSPSQAAPEFGRNKDMLESDCGTTVAGNVSSVPATTGQMQRRGKGSMFAGISTSEKFANSRKAGIKEGDYDDNRTGFAKPVRQDDERNSEFDDKMRKLTGMIFYSVNDTDLAQQLGLKQTRTGKWFLRTGNRVAQQAADKAFGPGKVWYPKNESVAEGEEMGTFAALKDWQVWDVHVFNNFYRGKYADYGPRLYSVVASSPEEARQVVINNPDYVLQDLLSRKLQNGKKVLPRGSALPVEEKRVGKAQPGTITTMGLKKMLTPDGVQSFKFTGGKIVDGSHVAGGEQVEEASFDYTTKDLGNDYAGFPSNHSMKHKFLARIKPEKQQLYKDKINNTHEWDDLFALFNVAKQRGDIIEQGVAEGVAETLPMHDAVKVLRQYGADNFKTTSNELHFYKNGRPLSVDLIWGNEGERSVNLSQLNSATRQLKGQGVSEDSEPEYMTDKNGKTVPVKPKKDGYQIRAEKKKSQQNKEQGVAESYPKQQDLSSISTDKLKTYLAKQSQQQVSGEGNQVKRVRAELQRREQSVSEESKGLWANIHAKRDRIKNGSGERMRKPGSKGAPTADALKKSATEGVAESEQRMSRAAKGNEKYGKDGMKELAKAGREGASEEKMDKIRDKHDNYNESIEEEFNPEYDDEAGMAETNLHTIARAAQGLIDAIGENENLPEWCQEKIAKVEGMLVAVWDYLESQEAQGIDPQVDEDWQKTNKQDKTDGMSPKAVKAYRRENPGSKLKTAVTTKPSKLKAGSKDAKRRKSFCARMSGNKGPMKDEKGRPTPKAKALSRWNCESVEQTVQMLESVQRDLSEVKQRLDPKCWKGFKKQGTKMKGGTRVNNCVPVSEAEVSEDKIANDLYKDFQIFKKSTDKDIGSKAKDKGIGTKPQAKDIVAKEGAKVDRMIGHVKSSEKKLGHSDKEAEGIAWATANKRGMLNNKNKK